MEPLIHFIRTVGSMVDFNVEEESDASAAAFNSDRASSAKNIRNGKMYNLSVARKYFQIEIIIQNRYELKLLRQI